MIRFLTYRSCVVGVLILLASGVRTVTAQVRHDTAGRARPDSTVFVLPDLSVLADRQQKSFFDTPLAITAVQPGDAFGTSGYGLNDALGLVPGVLAQSRYGNQDVRLVIRGFGARGAGDRSNAGTSRGIRVLLDGIPETEPDGRTSFDGIDLASAEHVEVIRSNASALWGRSRQSISVRRTPPTRPSRCPANKSSLATADRTQAAAPRRRGLRPLERLTYMDRQPTPSGDSIIPSGCVVRPQDVTAPTAVQAGRSLPYRKESDSVGHRARASGVSDRHVARVLVIEDDDIVGPLVRRVLQRAGHEVFLTSDSTSGLGLWRSEVIDLIVIDETGIEAIAKIRGLQPLLPIVVISAQDKTELFESIHAAGRNSGVRILTKPFEIDALASAVRALLRQSAPEKDSSE
jgi:CheY-like chemotaxis protein